MTARARGALVAVPILGAAIACAVLTLDHASQAVYAVPGWAVAATVALLCVTVAGCALLVWSRQPGFGAVVAAGVALAVLGFLGAASIGLPVLLFACGLLLWAGSRPRSPERRGRATAGAVLAGAPLPLLLILAIADPLVDCHSDGVTSGSNLFVSSSSEGSSSSGGADGAFSGRAEGDTYAYSYTCRDGRLVHFDLRDR